MLNEDEDSESRDFIKVCKLARKLKLSVTQLHGAMARNNPRMFLNLKNKMMKLALRDDNY